MDITACNGLTKVRFHVRFYITIFPGHRTIGLSVTSAHPADGQSTSQRYGAVKRTVR